MVIADRVREDLGARLAASFEGVPFGVESAEVSGGWQTASELQVGRGTRARPIAPSQRIYPLRGYITGPTARRDEAALLRAVNAGPGLLAHPWFGVVEVIASRYTVAWQDVEIEFARLTLDFEATEIPVVESGAAEAAEDAADAISRMTLEGAAFATEEAASSQLEELRPVLGIDAALQGGAFASAATEQLLGAAAAPTADVPRAIQEIGALTRTAEAGDLRVADVLELERRVLTEADRNDSSTLLALLEEAQLFVAQGALAVVTEADGESVQALAVASGQRLEVVARNNRSAVARWFGYGEVRL